MRRQPLAAMAAATTRRGGRMPLPRHRRRRAGALITVFAAAVALTPVTASVAAPSSSLTAQQRAALMGIARDTWQFFEKDLDPTTHLPLDNLGPGNVRGTYTSAANIGVYLWAVVSAGDLGIISRGEETSLARQLLTAVSHLERTYGFLYQWYDTSNGDVIRNPGDIDCAQE